MNTTWLDVAAARKRLAQIAGELQDIERERTLIETVLKGADEARPLSTPRRPGRPRGSVTARPAKGPARRQPGARRPAASRSTFIDLILEALRRGPPGGRTVAEIIAHIAANHPDRVSAANVSALTSAAIFQSRKAKIPRIKVLKQGGPGVPSKYGPA